MLPFIAYMDPMGYKQFMQKNNLTIIYVGQNHQISWNLHMGTGANDLTQKSSGF